MKTAVRTFSADAPDTHNCHKLESPDTCPLYDLISESGLAVSILPLGASIQRISSTDSAGREIPIALGFPDLGSYEDLICYAGATLGPNAGRIRNARLPVLETEHLLSQNDNGCQLHGGCHNLSSILWNTDSVKCTSDTASVLLSCQQADGLDGYPGNRRYQVRYTLSEQGILTIEQTAWTDRPTYVNLSNHTYWNLTGDFTRHALDQELFIHADQVCINDENHLPVSIIPVKNTAFDFRKQQSPANAIRTASDPISIRQLQISQGYNHGYLLQQSSKAQKTLPDAELIPACLLHDPISRRTVRLLTDAPAVVLYSGGFLPKGLRLLNGQRSVPSCAIALEAQDLPDAPHLLPSSCQLTLPEKPFHRIIQFHMFESSCL